MYTIVVRIYAAFLWVGLAVGYMIGYYTAENYAEQWGLQTASAPSPIVGGLVGLFIAILLLGAGLTLVGIYENTLATANASRRSAGSQSEVDSEQALREALPIGPGYQIAIAVLFLAIGLAAIYLLIPKPGT